MSKSNTAEFKPSVNRILLFLASIFHLIEWIQRVVGFTSQQTKNITEETVKQISPTEKYIERNKAKFLQTFKIENRDWSSNIELVIKDSTKLAEMLGDANNDLEKKWRSRVLIENTSRGNVIMFYDIYKRGFSYYCDNAVMPYDIMNAVAMKYVITFWCRDFFVDSNILPKPKEKNVSFEGIREEDKTELTTMQTNLQNMKITRDNNKQSFVKFKSYNTAAKKAGVSPEDDKTINCFLHLGGVRNWTPIMKKVKPNPINGFQTNMIPDASNKKLSYLEYKKRQSSSQ